MPALRKRTEDIPLLIQHFLQKHCDKMGRKIKRLTPEVVARPGELSLAGQRPRAGKHHRAHVRRRGAGDDHPREPAGGYPQRRPVRSRRPPALWRRDSTSKTHLDQVAKAYIQEAGATAGGNMRRMADLLGDQLPVASLSAEEISRSSRPRGSELPKTGANAVLRLVRE